MASSDNDQRSRLVARLHLGLVAALGLLSLAARAPSWFGASGTWAAVANDAAGIFAVYGVLVAGVLPVAAGWVLGNRWHDRVSVRRLRYSALTCHVASVVLLAIGCAVQDPTLVQPRWFLYMAYDSGATGASAPWLLGGVAFAACAAVLSALAAVLGLHGERAAGGVRRAASFALEAQAWAFSLAAPVLLLVANAALFERFVGLGLFIPASGGDAVLYQHLFWFAAHPLLFTAVLVPLGLAFDALTSSPPPRFTRTGFVAAALLSFFGWGQHLFAGGISDFAAMVFSAWALLGALPLLHLVIRAVATMRHGVATPNAGTALYAAAVLLAVAGFAWLAAGTATLSLSVGLDLVLYGSGGLELLLVVVGLSFALVRARQGADAKVLEPVPAR